MGFKDLWSKTTNWLNPNSESRQQDVDNDGLINLNEAEPSEPENKSEQAEKPENTEVIVKPVPQKDRTESMEKLQQSFGSLIEQLNGINEHLDRQADQHQQLMERIKQLPQLLEGLPAVFDNQKETTEQLLEHLKTSTAKNEQFVEAVEKIPSETAKQTDALVNIDHQLAAAADIDVQMSQSLNNFNQSLEKLNQSTISHKDSIMQMSKTFSASDRYLKYIISKQSSRFMWMFIAAISICTFAILILVGIIIYLKHAS